MRTIIIGTRGSDLALYQANLVREFLSDRHGVSATLEVIRTAGDKIDSLPFEKMEGKGFFTKELEDSLLAGASDIAVHSLKDLMTAQPPGLTIAAVGQREDRHDLLLFHSRASAGSGTLPLQPGSIIGAGSARRRTLIRSLNPDLKVRPIRGNVPTRIGKLRGGDYDAIIIAAAGVNRLQLDLGDVKSVTLDPEDFPPAPGQGTLAIQTRQDESALIAMFDQFGTDIEKAETYLERGLLSRFDAGCSLPLGVYSRVADGEYRLLATLGPADESAGIDLRRAEAVGDDPDEIIDSVFKRLTENA
ncbi:MAG: hydroxymethylbilane synthase [Candidatus Zixiibacteriota bacterium]